MQTGSGFPETLSVWRTCFLDGLRLSEIGPELSTVCFQDGSSKPEVVFVALVFSHLILIICPFSIQTRNNSQ